MASRGRALLNREAGSCGDPEAWRERLESAGFDVALPGSSEAARDLARRAALDGVGTVVAAGGDGTVHHVANGLLASGAPVPRLGVVPLGTANDYARGLGLPAEPDGAIDLLTEGVGRPVDVFEIRHRPISSPEGPATPGDGAGSGRPAPRATAYGLNVAVGGFGREVARRLGPEDKRTWGSLAYLKSAVEELGRLPRFRTRMEIGGTVREDVLLNVVAANGRFAGGGVPVAPKARLDDGRLRLVLIPALDLGELARLASRVLTGDHGARSMVVQDVRSVTVESDPPMYFKADGEEVGATPIEMDVLPGALEILRP